MSATTLANLSITTPTDALDSSSYCRTTLWYIVVGSAAGVYAMALLIATVHHIACSLCVSRNKLEEDQKRRMAFGKKHRLSLRTRMRLQCTALVKGANSAGKILLAMYSMSVVVSFTVYVLMTYSFASVGASGSKTLLVCYSLQKFPVIHVDFGINVFYAVVFVLRLVASDSKLSFFMSLETVADHLTLVPSFIMYGLGKYMIVFQYARLGGLKFLVNILIYCQILKGEKQIRLMKLLMQIIVAWLASAGFYQLIETVGDFWQDDGGVSTSNFMDFHVCFYTMLITMSTVGYGDFAPKTVLGKFFIIIFIIVALGMFTSIIPEVSEILTESRKYKKNRIHLIHGRKHVILAAGKFDMSTVNTFFNDFYHEGRSENKRNFVAMLGEEEPSPEMKALLKTRELYVTYLNGNLMYLRDLQRAELKHASATIILTDSLTQDPEDEDLKNIMRVIAIKDYCPNMRVLVQLHLYRSKTYLRNIPDWSEMHGDQALCINEMKYGVLAQSCIVPGVSTLLGNLLTLRSVKPLKDKDDDAWETEYMHGVEFEFYLVRFAPLFQGLTFLQACRLCYEQLGILLLAVQVTRLSSSGEWDQVESRQTVINPGSQLVISVATMEAFVIARDRRDAKRVTHLLLSPEEVARSAAVTDRCFSPQRHCEQQQSRQHQRQHQNSDGRPRGNSSVDGQNSPTSLELKSIKSNFTDKLDDHEASLRNPQPLSRSDSSLFHETLKGGQPTCHDLDSSGYFHWVPNRLAGSIMLTNQQRCKFRNHIVVCIVEKRRDVLLNITSFVMPLRASTIPREELKDLIFVGNVDLLFNEWSIIQNFPGIFALDGSPLNRANLKAINIEYADCCVIMSPKASLVSDNAQVDRETVLCTLNIKTMRHPETGRRLGDTIHIITELNSVGSIEYLDQDDEMEVDEPFMTQAFATGRTFYLSLLGSIATTIYFNDAALNFLRTILTTVDSDNLEIDLNEQGFHFMSPEHSNTLVSTGGMNPPQRSKIQLFSVCELPLRPLYRLEGDRCQWRDLMMRCIEQLEIVCIGLFRLQVPQPASKNHRFVITMPHPTMEVRQTDKVYCLIPPSYQDPTRQ